MMYILRSKFSCLFCTAANKILDTACISWHAEKQSILPDTLLTDVIFMSRQQSASSEPVRIDQDIMRDWQRLTIADFRGKQHKGKRQPQVCSCSPMTYCPTTLLYLVPSLWSTPRLVLSNSDLQHAPCEAVYLMDVCQTPAPREAVKLV